MYAKVAKYIKSCEDLTEDMLKGLKEILMDSSKAQTIMEASRMSMGMDIFAIDLINIQLFATSVIGLLEYCAQLSEFLITKMTQVLPNYPDLIDEHVGGSSDNSCWKFNKLIQVSSVNCSSFRC